MGSFIISNRWFLRVESTLGKRVLVTWYYLPCRAQQVKCTPALLPLTTEHKSHYNSFQPIGHSLVTIFRRR